MGLFELNLAIILFIVGNFIGLEYSYRKYSSPYVEKKIDKIALALSILGGILVNSPLYLLGCLLIGFPLGMRPGYGRIEFIVGLIIALLLYILRW
ncbi:energy-converting hydrogenase subunit EhaL family protein [Methanocaldococcus sp. 16A]